MRISSFILSRAGRRLAERYWRGAKTVRCWELREQKWYWRYYNRLMMLEAVQKGLVWPGNVARRLRERPDVVRALYEYARHAGRIDDVGLRILPVDGQVARASHEVRRGAGLLINDSISVAMMLKDGIRAIATQDRDFKRVPGLQVYLANNI